MLNRGDIVLNFTIKTMEQKRGKFIRFISVETFIHILSDYGLLNKKERDLCLKTRQLPDDIFLRIKRLDQTIKN